MLKHHLHSKFKLVTFDITGTLLKFKRPVGEQYAEAGLRFNLSLEPKLLTENFAKQWKQMNIDYPNYGLSAGLGWESWWRKVVHQTFINASPNTKLDEKKLNKISHYLTEIFKNEECWLLCDGAIDILEGLAESNTPVGVISNFDPRLEEVLENMKIRNYFKFIISSYTAGVEKPNSKIFQLAVQLNNDKSVKCCDIVHVGNSPSLDLQAALKAGWNACLVNVDEDLPAELLPTHANQNSYLIFKDLHHLKTYLLL